MNTVERLFLLLLTQRFSPLLSVFTLKPNPSKPFDLCPLSTEQTRESLDHEDDILFAYLYGSAAYDPSLSADIDIAVYLKPSNMKEYIKKEAELTTFLISQLNFDDLRDLLARGK